jgi:hypothetical protein
VDIEFLVGKPEGKRPLGRPRRRWENNIKTDIQEVDFEGMDWIVMAQDRDRWRVPVSAVMKSLSFYRNHIGNWPADTVRSIPQLPSIVF